MLSGSSAIRPLLTTRCIKQLSGRKISISPSIITAKPIDIKPIPAKLRPAAPSAARDMP